MKKFELTEETKDYFGRIFFRIVALVDIPDLSVVRGHKGGWLESESCLSHQGDCWVKNDAMIEDGSTVSGDAVITGTAYVGNNSSVSGYAIVDGDARVLTSRIYEQALIDDSARVENSSILGRATIKGNAIVKDSRIDTEVIIDENASVQCSELLGLERSAISGQAKVENLTITSGNPVKDLYITGNSEVHDVTISGLRIEIKDDASISNSTIEGKDVRLFGFSRIEKGVALYDNCNIGGFTTITLDGWGNELDNITLDTDMKITMGNYHLLR